MHKNILKVARHFTNAWIEF